jgi:hypothetical protein
MMIDELNNIQQRMAHTAAWRRRQCANRFPGDPRNQPAAERLEWLASEAPDSIKEATWDSVAAHLKNPMFDDMLSETSREIGFRHAPQNLNAFLVMLANKLDASAGVTL